MQPENATLKTLAQENAKKMQAKMQKQCSFWKFVFVKHAHFQNLHFFRIFICIFSRFVCIFFAFYLGFFAIFEKFEALTKPIPKNAKKKNNCNLHVCRIFFAFFRFLAFFAFFCILPKFFAIFEKFEAQTKPPPKNCKKSEKHAICIFLHFCSHFL